MRAFSPALIALVLLPALSPSQAAQDAALVFGTTADRVLIDLIAIDGEGRRVTDLRSEEIEVYEDGKRQRLEVLRFVGTSGETSLGTPATPPSLEPGPRAAPASPPPATPLSLVVVVDTGALPLELLVPARAAIVSMTRELAPGTRLMLVTLGRGMQVRQAFTDDVGRFVAAVENLKPSVASEESALSDLVGRPVTDKTGLTGLYDFTLKFAPEGRNAGPLGQTLALLGATAPAPTADPNAPTLSAALQEQLGLKLESARGLVEVVVIDKFEKPTFD